MESLVRYGQQTPLVVRGGVILKGNATFQAATRLGWSEIAAIPFDRAAELVRGYKLVDNRSAELATWAGEVLRDELLKLTDEGEDLLKLGWTSDEFHKLVGDGAIVEDVPPELPEKAKTKPGDLYVMGPHRLLCGSATDPEDVKRVLEGNDVDLIFTDPPWNVAIGLSTSPKHRQREGLQNDNLGANFHLFLKAWTQTCLPYLNGDLYCVMGCGEWPNIDAALREADIHWSSTIVWVKDIFVMGRSNYHRRFEPIWYGWPKKIGSTYNGARNLDDVWEIPRPRVSEDHPTMKPVELVARAITNSSLRGKRVFDPFSGAGSTLIACEQLGRTFAGIEIDPRYCDVIVARWEALTSQKAVLNP